MRRTRARGRRGRARGMTLVEIMVVVIIMGLVASGAAVSAVVLYERAKVRQAGTDVRTLQAATVLHLTQTGRCPIGVSDLAASGALASTSSRLDPWGSAFVIDCEPGHEPIVISAGPDRLDGTGDDVRSDEQPEPDEGS